MAATRMKYDTKTNQEIQVFSGKKKLEIGKSIDLLQSLKGCASAIWKLPFTVGVLSHSAGRQGQFHWYVNRETTWFFCNFSGGAGSYLQLTFVLNHSQASV